MKLDTPCPGLMGPHDKTEFVLVCDKTFQGAKSNVF